MNNQQPPTETMKISEVKQQLNRLVNEIYRGERRILVEKSGIPVAGLVSASDLRRLEDLDRAWDERTRAIERFSQAFADVPTDEAEADVERITAKTRADQRAERFKILEAFGEAFKDLPSDELEREIARALADVRAKQRVAPA